MNQTTRELSKCIEYIQNNPEYEDARKTRLIKAVSKVLLEE